MTKQKHLVQHWAPRIRFFLALLLALSLFSVFLFFIGTRLEHPDLTPAKPSSAETTRQDLAIESARIAAAAQNLGFTDLSATATGWEQTLGGVWVPWPEGAPEGYTNPELDLSASSTDNAALLVQIRTFAADLVNQGIAFADGSQMVLLASEVLRSADSFAQAAGIASANGLPSDNGSALDTSEISPALIAELISDPATVVELDFAKQVLEAHTAQLPSETVQRQINRENIALLNALISHALAGDLPDQRSSFIPPKTELERVQPVLINALSNLAIDEREQLPEKTKNSTAESELSKSNTAASDPAAATNSPTANQQLAQLIVQLQQSF